MLNLDRTYHFTSDLPNLKETLTEMRILLHNMNMPASSSYTLEARRKNLLEQVDSYLWRYEIEDVD